MSDASGWQRVAALSEIAQEQPFGAKYGEREIVLARYGGAVFALAGICPHAYALLSDGFLNGAEIECPLHAAAFDLRSGKCLTGPEGDARSCDLRGEGRGRRCPGAGAVSRWPSSGRDDAVACWGVARSRG